MKQDLIIEVMQKMALHLDNFQMKQLQSAMEAVLWIVSIVLRKF